MNMQEPKRLEVTAELVAQRIETLIMDGVLKPGQVLPSERQLTQRLAVSRSALREGLQVLRVRGLIETRHGKGSFVANLIDSTVSKPLEHLLQAQGRTLYDLLEVRELLESEAAQLAASRGTEADRSFVHAPTPNSLRRISSTDAKQPCARVNSLGNAAHVNADGRLYHSQ